MQLGTDKGPSLPCVARCIAVRRAHVYVNEMGFFPCPRSAGTGAESTMWVTDRDLGFDARHGERKKQARASVGIYPLLATTLILCKGGKGMQEWKIQKKVNLEPGEQEGWQTVPRSRGHLLSA